MAVWIAPAGRRGVDLLESSAAFDRLPGVDHTFHDPRGSGDHLEGGTRRCSLLGRVVEHRLGRIPYDLGHIVAVRDPAAVVTGVTYERENRAVRRISDDNRSAEGIQVKLTGCKVIVLDQAPDIVVGSPVPAVFDVAADCI